MKKDLSIVSICMITYNHEQFIKEAIEGILAQNTTFSIQLVIGEDFSTDSTREICEDFAQKNKKIINLLKSDRNLGLGFNGYRTMQACTGKYIAMCEGDDYWTDPYKLQKQVDFLEANSDFSICFHDVRILKNGELLDDYITRPVPEETDILELTKGNYIHTPSVLYRNELFGNYPEQLLRAPVGDYFLHMLHAKYGKIKKIREVMAVYRIHDGNTHFNKPQSQKNEEWLTQLNLMIPSFEGEVKNRLISLFLQHAKHELVNNTSISEQRQSEIIKLIYEFSPDYLVTVMKENEMLRCQQTSLSYKVRAYFSKIKRKTENLIHNSK